MKKNLLISLKLTAILIILLAILYPLLLAAVGRFAAGNGGAEKLMVNGKVVGYANIGQKFTDDKYFWGRPSAVDYNAAGSAGSNKGPSNPDYLKLVQDRIDSFLVHNTGVKRNEIPADIVTASGSGLDPDISPAAALIQVNRVAQARNINSNKINELVKAHIEKPFLGLFGPSKVNVLKLNIALEQIH